MSLHPRFLLLSCSKTREDINFAVLKSIIAFMLTLCLAHHTESFFQREGDIPLLK